MAGVSAAPALAPRGHVQRVLVFEFVGETIGTADVVVDPEALAELTIAIEGGRLVLIISDDGRGFDPGAPEAGGPVRRKA